MAVVVSDSFTRADSATGLGTADTGQVWSNYIGAAHVLGIKSNQAYVVNAPTDSDDHWILDPGISDYTISCLIANVGPADGPGAHGSIGLSARVSAGGTGDFLFIQRDGLWKSVGFGASQLDNFGTPPMYVSGDTVSIKCKGTEISVYVNGTLMFAPHTVTQFQTNTRCGLWRSAGLSADDVNIRWDDYKVESFGFVGWTVGAVRFGA